MGDERRQKKQAKKIVEKKSNGVTPTWKKMKACSRAAKCRFPRRSGGETKEEEEEEEEEENVFKSLFGGARKGATSSSAYEEKNRHFRTRERVNTQKDLDEDRPGVKLLYAT